jgi:hypothetical protein
MASPILQHVCSGAGEIACFSHGDSEDGERAVRVEFNANATDLARSGFNMGVNAPSTLLH